MATKPNQAANRKLHGARINALKESMPCMDCQQFYPGICMDFDHRPGEVKKFSIATGKHSTWQRLEAEMAKCDLVCANCHRLRTERRRLQKAAQVKII